MSHIKQNPLRIIGACAPSSQGLALAMARFVAQEKKQNILEIGAGTGAITGKIVKSMGPHHRLDVVEIFPVLAKFLRNRFANMRRVSIHALDIQKFQPAQKYDIIISSLPFNSMNPEAVEPIIKHILFLANPGAIMSFFEYKIIQKLALPFMGKAQLSNFLQTRKHIDDLLKNYEFENFGVGLNIPPAMVHYLKLGKLRRK